MKIEKLKRAETACSVAEPADPRARRTRKLLEESFRTLIHKKSFATVSVQDITEHATVNRATFYAHYTDKNDLATSVLRNDLRHTIYKRFGERPTFTPENLVEMATTVFGFLETMYAACPKGAAEMVNSMGNTLQAELYEIMEQWLSGDNTYLRSFPGCTKSTVATVLSCSIYGGAQRWSQSSPREPAAQVCREIVSILLPPSR